MRGHGPGWMLLCGALLVVASARGDTARSRLAIAPAGEPGERLELRGRVLDRGGNPVAGARVHAYQTDASGHYTRERAMDEPHARLAGWLTCDRVGAFELSTIRPGGYPRALRLGDRERHIPAHLHLDVAASGHATRKWQAVFADDSLLADSYWQEWVRKLGQPVLHARLVNGTWWADLELVLE